MEMRKVLIAMGVALPLLSAGVVFGVPGGARVTWNRMEHWAKTERQSWERSQFDRPVAWGESTEGNAFDDYEQAIAQTLELGRADEELLRALRLQPETVDAADRQGFSRRWQPVWDAMSRGAHRKIAKPPVEWERGCNHGVSNLLVCRDLVNSAGIEVRRRFDNGRTQQAVELTLDSLAFACDLMHSPLAIDKMVAAALVAIAAGEYWTDAMVDALSEQELDLLGTGLSVIDTRCPTSYDWRGESLLLAHHLLEPENMPAGGAMLEGGAGRVIEFGWSEKWAAADAVMQQVRLWDEFGRRAETSWPARRRLLEQLGEQVEASSNPVLRSTQVNVFAAERTIRSALAAVRVFRAAVAERGGDDAKLQDPLGEGSLQVEAQSDGRIVVSSSGESTTRSRVFRRTVTQR
jgi:hypothetical protein